MLIRTIFKFVQNPAEFLYLKPRPEPPEVLRRGEFRHNFLQLYDGKIRLHYVEAGDPKKPLLLFLHGFPEFWYSWRHQLRAFQNDFHVVAIDMRGYGESSKPKGIDEYSIPNLVEDIRQVISILGKGKTNLVAHDWGGIISWRFVSLYPEMVEKFIVLNSPHSQAYQDRLRSGFGQWLMSWYMYAFQVPYLPEIALRANDMRMLISMISKPPMGCTDPNALKEEDIEAWKYTFQQPGAMTPPINYYRSMIPRLLKGAPPTGAAEQNVGKKKTSDLIQPPTLIIWGTADAALEKEMANGSIKYCQNATVRLIEGASHWVQQDRPELCNQYMREFLNI